MTRLFHNKTRKPDEGGLGVLGGARGGAGKGRNRDR